MEDGAGVVAGAVAEDEEEVPEGGACRAAAISLCAWASLASSTAEVTNRSPGAAIPLGAEQPSALPLAFVGADEEEDEEDEPPCFLSFLPPAAGGAEGALPEAPMAGAATFSSSVASPVAIFRSCSAALGCNSTGQLGKRKGPLGAIAQTNVLPQTKSSGGGACVALPWMGPGIFPDQTPAPRWIDRSCRMRSVPTDATPRTLRPGRTNHVP